MKKPILIQVLAIVTLTLALRGNAAATGIPVVDAAHIASNRVSQAIDYVQQVLHEANQQTQILKEVEQIEQLYTQIEQLYAQIEQMDDYLERFGDPKEILDLAGFDKLMDDLGRATGGLDIESRLPDLDGQGMFEFDGEGVFEPIESTVTIGNQDFERDAGRYKPNDAARATIEQYREKKAQVIERRDALREEIASTAGQLRAAETDSEVKKLSGVLLSQQTELQAIDRELDIARGDAEARALENANQDDAQAKADAEAEARRFEEGNRRDLETYQLDQSPYGW